MFLAKFATLSLSNPALLIFIYISGLLIFVFALPSLHLTVCGILIIEFPPILPFVAYVNVVVDFEDPFNG